VTRSWWHSLIIWTSVGAFAIGLLAGAALVVPQTSACDCHSKHEAEHAELSTQEWRAGYDAGSTAREHIR